MGGYTPKARLGLIALIASRRIMAEKGRRELAAQAGSAKAVKAAAVAEKKTKRSGWFR